MYGDTRLSMEDQQDSQSMDTALKDGQRWEDNWLWEKDVYPLVEEEEEGVHPMVEEERRSS